MKKPKILILIGGHLSTAPRPQKEAAALADEGYEVVVKGLWFDPQLIQFDKMLMANSKYIYAPIIDFSPAKPLANFWTRIRNRANKELHRLTGIFTPELLGYATNEMLRAALEEKADLTIVHSESGMWVGVHLLDLGHKVGIDFEDWFSEDLPEESRQTRPVHVLKKLERRLINECQYCVTTSDAMAEAMAKAYQSKKPIVIYNTFPRSDRNSIDGLIKDRRSLELPSLFWFSQTIGPNRGLETLFKSLSSVRLPVEVHLRGRYSDETRQWIFSFIPDSWKHNMFLHPLVPNNELLSRISEHDIGLAIDDPYCPNKMNTITNKLFQYLQGGLAMIATETAGNREILSQAPNIGYLIPPRNPIALADAINNLISSKEQLGKSKNESIKTFKDKFNWERERLNLIANVRKALN